MIITNGVEWRVLIADIETLLELSLFSFYNPDTGEWIEFEISKRKNDLWDFVKFYGEKPANYIVWYNGIAFDCPVIEYVMRNHHRWVDLSNEEIVEKIYGNAQDVISDRTFGKQLRYLEDSFTVPCIDVFELNGLSNAARMSSLKKIEFQIDWPSVEEMPIHHGDRGLGDVEMDMIRSYCRNDILATYELFKITMGNTEHPLYKGNNQVALRIDIQNEFGLKCISYSDIKIGDELMKMYYAKDKGLDVWNLPRKGYFRKTIKLRDCIPEWVCFKTQVFKKILADLRKKVISMSQKHEVEFTYGMYDTKYVIGLGGGHSVNKNESWFEDDDHVLIDLDVASLYPAIIVNEGYIPKHLGKELLRIYATLYNRRIELKPLSKKDKKIKGLCDAIKLLLNSAYGIKYC